MVDNRVEPIGAGGGTIRSGKNKKTTKDSEIQPEIEDGLENGPIFKRHCTDILWCPLFVLFCVGMCWAFVYGLSDGNPVRLTVLFDYDGNGCGYNTGFKDHDYIYWPKITWTSSFSEIASRTMWVSRCPTIANPLATNECKTNSIFTDCTTATPVNYDSVLYVNKFCLADTSSASSSSTYTAFKDKVMEDYGGNYLTTYMADVYYCWWVFLVCAGIAFIMGFVYMVFLKCWAKILVWITIFLGFFILGGCGIFLYLTASTYDKTDNTRDYMKYTAYGLFGICAVYLLVVLWCCNRLRLGIAILQTTADYINATPKVFIVPILFFLLIIAWFAYWIVSAIWIWSVGEVKKRSDSPFATMKWTEETRYVFLYNLFGLFWINAFLIGCSQFILAVSAATWYFTHTADSGGSASLSKGFKWILRYHLGSIAFGSLVIAICEFIKFMFEYYRKQMTGRVFNNPFGKCLLWSTRYCLNCLNRVVKYISKMAYIQMALTSSNFCMSAWKAFVLIVGNAGRFAVASLLGVIFMWIGKIFIVGATVILWYIIIISVPSIEENLSSPFFPWVLFALIAYVVASIFLSIFGFSMDTILQCFLVDETLAPDGSFGPHRPRTLDAFAKKKMIKSKCCGCC